MRKIRGRPDLESPTPGRKIWRQIDRPPLLSHSSFSPPDWFQAVKRARMTPPVSKFVFFNLAPKEFGAPAYSRIGLPWLRNARNN